MHKPTNLLDNILSGKTPSIILLGGVTILFAWIAVSTYIVGSSAESLMEQRVVAMDLLETDPLEADPEELRNVVETVERDITRINYVLSPMTPLTSRLGWIPRVGPLLEVSPELLEIAVAGGDLAIHGYSGFEPLLIEFQRSSNDNLTINQLVHKLDVVQINFRNANEAYERLEMARAGIKSPDRLPWRIRSLLYEFDRLLPMAKTGLLLAQAAPDLLGRDGRRTYLILAQNEDEIRATGGFISGTGIISIDNGEISSMSFEDADLIGDVNLKPYNWPPAPFQAFMGLDYFLFRDANFWPDFPTSAEQAMTLYSYDRNTHIDGVIAIDQEFLRLLVRATGPINVRALDRTINASNVVDLMREQWGPQAGEDYWMIQRNDFMQPLAEALFSKLTGSPQQLEPVALGRMIYQAASEKHLQIYVRDPKVARLLEKAGWTGRNHYRGAQDYLNVIDMNVGYNKVNTLIRRNLEYLVDLERDGTAQANLSIKYSHEGSSSARPCEHGLTPYLADSQYNDLVDQCYWNYVRVYVPRNSVRIRSSESRKQRLRLLTGWYEPREDVFFHEDSEIFEIFDELFMLPIGEELVLNFTYTLPNVANTLNNGTHMYKLELKKQSGLIYQEVQLNINLPESGQLVSAVPYPTNISDTEISFLLDQRTDLEILLIYELGEN